MKQDIHNYVNIYKAFKNNKSEILRDELAIIAVRLILQDVHSVVLTDKQRINLLDGSLESV